MPYPAFSKSVSDRLEGEQFAIDCTFDLAISEIRF